jgi:hypothetical protein
MVNSVRYVFYQPLHNYTDVTVPWKLTHACHNAYNKCDKGFQSLNAQCVVTLKATQTAKAQVHKNQYRVLKCKPNLT